jgi:hypothetical protein
MKLTRILAATSTFAALALLVVACTSSTLSPSSPEAAAGGTTFSCEKPEPEICGNGIDDDCDGKVDEDCPPTCKPVPEVCGDNVDNDCDGQIDENCTGQTCSPGYWRNAGYPTHFDSVCQAAANASTTDVFDDCGDLLFALGGPTGCKGGDAACHRQEAATLLNTAAGGCFE